MLRYVCERREDFRPVAHFGTALSGGNEMQQIILTQYREEMPSLDNGVFHRRTLLPMSPWSPRNCMLMVRRWKKSSVIAIKYANWLGLWRLPWLMAAQAGRQIRLLALLTNHAAIASVQRIISKQSAIFIPAS